MRASRQYAAACLAAFGAAGLCASAFAQTYEQLLVPYAIPSPSGTATILKHYVPGRLGYQLSALIGPRALGSDTVPLMTGINPDNQRGADGLLVGWNGDSQLIFGWPNGFPSVPGPERVGGIEIAYVNYDRYLTKNQPRRVDKITLQNVEYVVQEIEHENRISCVIEVKGIDGTFFDAVSVKIVGHGTGTKRVENILGSGSVSIEFSLVRLPGSRSPPLTLTQARLGDVDPYSHGYTVPIGSVQDGMGLQYRWFYVSEAPEFFKVLRSGNYSIRYSLTFGEQEIVYLVRDPISPAAAAAYQKCEARTNIFQRLIGIALDPQ